MQILVPVFEEAVLPHLDAAYNLARWLTHNEKDAEDVVQEACLRAMRHFSSFKGGDGRPWLLAIVRNTFYTWIKHNRLPEAQTIFADEIHPEPQDIDDPETLLLRETDKQAVRSALLRLPAAFREVMILREFEELSYKQIADVVQIPRGTVMSRLARARRRLAQILLNRDTEVTQAELGGMNRIVAPSLKVYGDGFDDNNDLMRFGPLSRRLRIASGECSCSMHPV